MERETRRLRRGPLIAAIALCLLTVVVSTLVGYRRPFTLAAVPPPTDRPIEVPEET